ncbi:hypothetical protein WJX72_005410 [[Myrmecia] bisecta]|uniref:Complex 1 LYR protein domain-containing protein n=1 Tax=[Myrmecia] bisecta TaxID=41462 RepID=A0AAW1R6W2_9CHLO
MADFRVPLLYRQILRAAKQFPSIKRNQIVEDIRQEFQAHKNLTDSGAIRLQRQLAVDGLRQLEDYVGVTQKKSNDWDLSLRGNSMS